jgi:hypothetical protein
MSVTWIDPGLLPSPTAASSFSDSVSPAHVNDSANGALLNPRHQTGRRGQRRGRGQPDCSAGLRVRTRGAEPEGSLECPSGSGVAIELFRRLLLSKICNPVRAHSAKDASLFGAERWKDDTISIPVGVGSAARCARSTSSGEMLFWDLLSSLRSMSSSSLRFIERMIALSEVDFKPSMAAETSRDTITCTHRTVRARWRCPLRRALQRELPSSGSGANSRQ